MEPQDWHMIGADCFVLSCCCQCLILQILVFLLLKLPSKVFRKTKEYVKRKFGIRRKMARCAAAVIGRQPPRRAVESGGRLEELHGCMEEVEKVLEEMCKKGEFGFGSFWRRDDDYDDDLEDNFRICFVNQQLGYYDDDGEYHFIQVVMAQLPSNQVSLLKDIFARFDLDSDGSLTHLELAALFRSVGLKPDEEIESLLAEMDENGNGSIEFEELLNAMFPDYSEEEEVFIDQEQLMKAFSLFDKDGNGSITPVELASQMAKMGHPLTSRELNDLMNDIDTNGDGMISFHEFTAAFGMPASEFFGIRTL